MAQHLPDLRLAAQAADRRHLARERCGVGYPGAGLALAEAAVEDELHVETADRGGRLEHLGLDPAGTVPGRLAARRRIQREHPPAAARPGPRRRRRRDTLHKGLHVRGTYRLLRQCRRLFTVACLAAPSYR